MEPRRGSRGEECARGKKWETGGGGGEWKGAGERDWGQRSAGAMAMGVWGARQRCECVAERQEPPWLGFTPPNPKRGIYVIPSIDGWYVRSRAMSRPKPIPSPALLSPFFSPSLFLSLSAAISFGSLFGSSMHHFIYDRFILIFNCDTYSFLIKITSNYMNLNHIGPYESS